MASLLHLRGAMNSAPLSPDQPAAGAGFSVPAFVPTTTAAEYWAMAREHEAAGRIPQALDACEGCLRIDSSNLDAWFMLATLAQRIGHRDFLHEVLEVVRALAPDEPRLAAFAASEA